MTNSDIKAMTTEQLKETAKLKGKNGNASSDAAKAQFELSYRDEQTVWHGVHKCWFLSDEC